MDNIQCARGKKLSKSDCCRCFDADRKCVLALRISSVPTPVTVEGTDLKNIPSTPGCSDNHKGQKNASPTRALRYGQNQVLMFNAESPTPVVDPLVYKKTRQAIITS